MHYSKSTRDDEEETPRPYFTPDRTQVARGQRRDDMFLTDAESNEAAPPLLFAPATGSSIVFSSSSSSDLRNVRRPSTLPRSPSSRATSAAVPTPQKRKSVSPPSIPPFAIHTAAMRREQCAAAAVRANLPMVDLAELRHHSVPSLGDRTTLEYGTHVGGGRATLPVSRPITTATHFLEMLWSPPEKLPQHMSRGVVECGGCRPAAVATEAGAASGDDSASRGLVSYAAAASPAARVQRVPFDTQTPERRLSSRRTLASLDGDL